MTCRRHRRPGPAPPEPPGLERCYLCDAVLTAVTEDPVWPGICRACGQTLTGPLRYMRRDPKNDKDQTL